MRPMTFNPYGLTTKQKWPVQVHSPKDSIMFIYMRPTVIMPPITHSIVWNLSTGEVTQVAVIEACHFISGYDLHYSTQTICHRV